MRDVAKGSARRLGLLLVGALLLLGAEAFGQGATDFALTMHGVKTWTLSFGIGDPQGLASAALAPYQFGLDQSLSVDVEGRALSVLTVKAHFNDQEPASMQSLTVTLDADELQGVFGDFSLSGIPAFAAYNKKLRGAELDYRWGEATLSGVVAQVQGISESKTFVGHTAHQQLVFSRTQADQPWLDAPYLVNLAGLFHYRLRKPFVEGFSQASLVFDVSGSLRSTLAAYGLDFLEGTIEKNPAKDLSTGAFLVVTSDADYLLLKTRPADLVRDRVKGYIDDYNKGNALTGTDCRTYPFNVGTDYERTFLDRVAASVNVVVDGDGQPLAGAGRERFYTLGQTDLKEDSLLVEVSLEGGTFRPITDPDLAEFHVTPHAAQGVLEVAFPESFFQDSKSALRVSFDYAISGDLFTLGLSLVPGSERVYLNGNLLTRDTDYTIDYEVGALLLLTKVGDEDTIRIDYERQRGGLGSSAEYASTFYGATLKVPVSQAVTLELSTVGSQDSATPLVEADLAHTMPNHHVVTGLVGAIRLDGFSADVELGLNHDEFPLDDNERTNLPNQVTAILPVAGSVFVSDYGGLSVFAHGEWSQYDTSDGLSGNRIYTMQTDGERVFFGTSSGLTVLSLVGEEPLAEVGNWRRYAQADGLPDVVVRGLALADGVLWVGTEGGLASVPVDELDDPTSWKTYSGEAFAAMGKIFGLAVGHGVLYVAAEGGVFRLDTVAGGQPVLLPLSSGLAPEALFVEGETLYVASPLGLRSFQDGEPAGWVTLGEAVHAVVRTGDELWYGTDQGLRRASTATPALAGWAITALAVDSDGTLWVGSRADADYRLAVWAGGEAGTRFDNAATGIDGRDRSRFADIPAQGHTDQGVLGRLSFERDLGTFSVSGSFETVSPTFTSIGRLDRSDSTGWEVAATGRPGQGVDLSVSHSYYVTDARRGRPTATMDDRLKLGWDFGPHVGFTLSSGLTNDDLLHDGFDAAALSYTVDLSDQLLADALRLGLDWASALNADLAEGSSSWTSHLSANASWTLSPDLSLAATWSRPVDWESAQASGTETWTTDASFGHLFAPVRVTAHYAGTASRALAAGSWRADHEARLGLSIDRVGAGSWQLTPSLDVTGASQSGVLSASGRGNLRGTVGSLTLQGSWGVDLSGLGQPRLQRTDRLNLALTFSGWPTVRPNLSYTESTTSVLYGGESRGTVARSLTAHVLWTPEPQARDDLSISIRGTDARDGGSLSATAQNSLAYTISDVLSGRLDFDGTCERGVTRQDLSASLKGTVDLTLSQTWRASGSLSYLFGWTPSTTFYQSLLLELFVSATF